MKTKTLFLCNECGYQSSKWIGKCPDCESWNSFIEDAGKTEPSGKKKIQGHARAPREYSALLENLASETKRIETNIAELDQVLGGGIMPGSLILLGGEPGIGKSTLTLQVCEKISAQKKSVLYISGEESENQIGTRAQRLGMKMENVKLLSEVNLGNILATLESEKPDFAVIDSIQTIFADSLPSFAGTVSQVRFCTEAIMEYAKPRKLPVLLIGHVTKDGNLAGPRVLEHLVDGVFLLEGDRTQEFRILRGLKNRYGPTNEVGIFEMNENGLCEVKNPSARFLEERNNAVAGTALVCTVEGTRSFLVEVQALTSPTRFGYPRRAASGFDVNRLNLLLAVLERHLRLNFGDQDVYVNVVGGLKLSEPASDLAVAMAILSSLRKKPLPPQAVFVGEMGLSGEIRKATHHDRRAKEIKKLGLELVASSGNSPLHVQKLTAQFLA